MRLGAIAICTLAFCASAFSSANAATPQVGLLNGYRVEAQFVDPDANGGTDNRPVIYRLRDMINAVPAGGSIVMGLYTFDSSDIYDALKGAYQRGVTVKVVQSGSEDVAGSWSSMLHSTLGANHVFCNVSGTSNDSCHGPNAPAIQHAKFALFSSTTDLVGTPHNNVAWFGTANLTAKTGAQSINDTITVYDDSDLVGWFFWHLFLSDWNQTPRTMGFNTTADGHFTSPATGIDVEASPAATDLVVDKLSTITPGTNCSIRVLEFRFERYAVAKRLADMAIGGCSVKIMADEWDCASLNAVSNKPNLVYRRRSSGLHSKTIIVQGNSGHRFIFTGSHNIEDGALARDDIFVKVPVDTLPSIYNGYLDMFNRAWNSANDPIVVGCGGSVG